MNVAVPTLDRATTYRPELTQAWLSLDGLHVRAGEKTVLDGASLDVARGEVVAILGRSGSGKTTLLRTVLGEVSPFRGRVLLAGRDVTTLPVERRGVGIVYQGYALFPHMTVSENVAYGLRARGVDRASRLLRVDELLELVRLSGQGARFPDQLSGGERQRVALARALAPSLLLLDEPFSALDPATRAHVLVELRALFARVRVTTLLVTHDREDARALADRTVVVEGGRVVERREGAVA